MAARRHTARRAARHPKRGQPSATSPPAVLVIAHDPEVCRRFTEALHGAGYHPRVAYSAVAGLAEVHHREPALVLLDLPLPDLDGLALLGGLRADPRTAKLPVLVVLDPERAETRTACLAAGVRAVLPRSIGRTALLRLVRAHAGPPGGSRPRTGLVRGPWERILAQGISRLVHAGLDATRVCQAVVDGAEQLVGLAAASLWLVDGEHLELRVQSSLFDAVDRPHTRIPIGEGLLGEVARLRRPAAVSDVARDARIKNRAVFAAIGLRALIAVPLVHEGRLLGVLSGARRSGQGFTPGDVRALEALAEHAAAVLEQVRVLRESEGRRQTAEALAALATGVSATESPEPILGRVVEYAQGLIGADVAYLALQEPGTHAVPIAVVRGHRSADFARVKIGAGRGASGWVLRYGRSFRAADYLTDSRISHELDESVRAERLMAVLAVPVNLNGRVAGVLWAGRRQGLPFTGEDERVLGHLAAEAAVALGNIWLYREAQAARQRFHDLVQGLDAIVWEADATTWQFSFVSRRAEHLLGYAIERWLTEPDFWVTLVHPEDREQAVAQCLSATRDGRDHDFEYRVVAADGRVVWLRNMVHVVKDAEGCVRHLRGVMIDISAQKQAADALRDSEGRLQAILDHSPAIIYVKDTAGRYLLVNRGFDVLVRTDQEPVLGRTDHEIFPEAIADAFRANDRKVVDSGAPLEFEELAPHAGGLHTSISIKFPLRDAEGSIYAICGISTDITTRKQAEEALHQSEERLRQGQKMEAIGRLAGGIAHDFNNMLTAITGYSELLLTRLGTESPLKRDVVEIKKAAERAVRLIGQLLAFGRRQVLQPKVLDLNRLVADLQTMLGRLIGEHIQFVTAPAPDLGRVKADPGQVEQVIVNLVLNARDAMPQGGRLLLETANVDLDEAYVERREAAQPGRYIRLAVSDTGCGMDEATQARLFEPFFTTKEPGKGTGLGLATVYGVVKQSGGYIWIYSEPGHGTTVKIYLPRVDDPADAQASVIIPAGAAGGPETILLVEDDDVVRRLARQALEGAGYQVLEARDGDEGLRIGHTHEGPIALVLTDMVMPGTGGGALVERLAAVRSGFRTLYVSGYTDTAVLQARMVEPGTAFLAKPFTPGGLVRKVREVLDGDATARVRS